MTTQNETVVVEQEPNPARDLLAATSDLLSKRGYAAHVDGRSLYVDGKCAAFERVDMRMMPDGHVFVSAALVGEGSQQVVADGCGHLVLKASPRMGETLASLVEARVKARRQ